ncbi:hypothetical protein EGW08_020746 [Elysia chlorotica]|uniref:Uncharacterized protein n=1 Tax=Elysia chlorotica TaxID=188477 RepID=A0A433SQJ4_ELYCH|nr:hypothetical protein EGW08_020746 [Elysia chlorotica]
MVTTTPCMSRSTQTRTVDGKTLVYGSDGVVFEFDDENNRILKLQSNDGIDDKDHSETSLHEFNATAITPVESITRENGKGDVRRLNDENDLSLEFDDENHRIMKLQSNDGIDDKGQSETSLHEFSATAITPVESITRGNGKGDVRHLNDENDLFLEFDDENHRILTLPSKDEADLHALSSTTGATVESITHIKDIGQPVTARPSVKQYSFSFGTVKVLGTEAIEGPVPSFAKDEPEQQISGVLIASLSNKPIKLVPTTVAQQMNPSNINDYLSLHAPPPTVKRPLLKKYKRAAESNQDYQNDTFSNVSPYQEQQLNDLHESNLRNLENNTNSIGSQRQVPIGYQPLPRGIKQPPPLGPNVNISKEPIILGDPKDDDNLRISQDSPPVGIPYDDKDKIIDKNTLSGDSNDDNRKVSIRSDSTSSESEAAADSVDMQNTDTNQLIPPFIPQEPAPPMVMNVSQGKGDGGGRINPIDLNSKKNTTTEKLNDDDTNDSGLHELVENPWAIVGISVAVAVILQIAIIIFCLCKKGSYDPEKVQFNRMQ